MSAFTIFTAALACLAPFASAYTTPTGDSPVGNPFSAPGLGSTVPVGQPFTVQWAPSTSGTVTLVLLKGPASGLSVVGPIAEKIDNSGSFSWTPSTDLTEGPTSTTGYGIQLIVDSNGQYQYTTQFGISNSASGGSSSNSTSSAAASAAASSGSVIVIASSAPSTDASAASSAPTTTIVLSSTDPAASASASVPVVVTLPTTSQTTLITASATVSGTGTRSTIAVASRTTGAVTSSTGAAPSIKRGLLGIAAVAGAAVLAL